MLLCICKGISEAEARQIVNQGDCSLKQLRCQTGLGTQCGLCRKPASQLIHQVKGGKNNFLPVLASTNHYV